MLCQFGYGRIRKHNLTGVERFRLVFVFGFSLAFCITDVVMLIPGLLSKAVFPENVSMHCWTLFRDCVETDIPV